MKPLLEGLVEKDCSKTAMSEPITIEPHTVVKKFKMLYEPDPHNHRDWPKAFWSTIGKATYTPNFSYSNIDRVTRLGRPEREYAPPNYICGNQVASEYYIGKQLTKLVEEGLGINYLRIHQMVVCPLAGKHGGTVHITMEKADTDAYLSDKCWKAHEEVVCLQLLGALAVAQSRLRLLHNDVKTDNIFLRKVGKREEYRGVILEDTKEWGYNIGGGEVVKFGRVPFVLMLADYGVSGMWPDVGPVVISRDASTGFVTADGDTWVPNYYLPCSDVIFGLDCLARTIPDGLASKIITEITGMKYTHIPKGASTGRPKIKWLEKLAKWDAVTVLRECKVLAKYRAHMIDTSKIAILGIVGE